MFSKFLVAAAVVATTLVSAQNRPADNACITWEKSSYFEPTPDPSTLAAVGTGWVIGSAGSCDICIQKGDLIPCFSDDASLGDDNTFGHHDYLPGQIPNDYCRIWNAATGNVHMANNFYLPKRGPHYNTIEFILTQSGATVPAHAISYHSKVLAQSTQNAPGCCAGINFVGWSAETADGKFTDTHFAIQSQPVTTHTFSVGICRAAKTTMAPTTAGPTASPPTIPPATHPFIRFAAAVPTSKKVTATITQGAVSHTWKCYSFGEFSNWFNLFKDGNGNVTIYDCETNAMLITQEMLLTPGPLVIAIKGYWPLNQFSLEGIAASYVPAQPGKSGARLFNLMPDVPAAGMKVDGKIAVNGIAPYDGSIWTPLEDETKYTFTAFNNVNNKTLTTASFGSPSSPFVFTNFLIGMANATSGNFKPRFVSLIDASEQ